MGYNPQGCKRVRDNLVTKHQQPQLVFHGVEVPFAQLNKAIRLVKYSYRVVSGKVFR